MRSPYERTLAAELASGERHDSLFLGIYLGMSAPDFYQQCWQLNRDSLVRQGPSNLSVQHLIEDFRDVTYMQFYPTFTRTDTPYIYEMPVLFEYQAWTPWNPEFHADSLLPEVLARLRQWYGGDFMRLEHPRKGVAYVKIDGNRRLTVFRKSNRYVQATFTDMLAEEAEESTLNPQASE